MDILFHIYGEHLENYTSQNNILYHCLGLYRYIRSGCSKRLGMLTKFMKLKLFL